MKTMKNTLKTTVAIAVAVLVSSTCASASWSADFTDSSQYINNQTVIGQNGWSAVRIDSGNDSDAGIITDPFGSGNQVLRLWSTQESPTAANQWTYIQNNITLVEGSLIGVQIKVAIDALSTSAGLPFRINLNNSGTTYTNTPLEVGFEASMGWYYNNLGSFDSSTNRVAIDKFGASAVKEGYYYTIDYVFDFSERKTTLTISGLDSNDEAITETIGNIAFWQESGGPNGIENIQLNNSRGANRQYVYVESISAIAIPEPTTVASILGLLALAGTVFFRRQRN